MERQAKTEDGFYDLLIKRAFNPEDTFGMGEVLKRIAPIPKATFPNVEFELTAKTPSEQSAQIMKAVSDGKIAPDVGSMLITSMASMLKIKEVTELEDRIKHLESLNEQD